MKNTNKSTKVNKVNRKDMHDLFKDHDTQATDHHLTESCKHDLEMFRMTLWYAWLKEASDMLDGVQEKELDDITYQYFNLQKKVEKVMEFAELAQYATGFEIPEDRQFRFIDIEALEDKS